MEKKKKEEGIVEGFFGALGLEKFINTLKRSESVQERLSVTNEEIEERIKSGEAAKPVIKGKISIRPLSKYGISATERKFVTRVRPKEREIIVDIEETEKEVKVIVELPGVKENEISLELKNKTLLIKARTQRKYVYLPCAVGKEISKTFNNAILEVNLKKK